MTSKFRSSKSYPRPPHVCRAPIPGNPQPELGWPTIIWMNLTWDESVTGPTVTHNQLLLLQPDFFPWFWNVGLETTDGWIINVILAAGPTIATWGAYLSLEYGGHVYPTPGFPASPLLSIYPTAADAVTITAAAPLGLCTAYFHQ